MRVVRLVTWLVLLVTTCSTQAEEDVDDYTDDINGSTVSSLASCLGTQRRLLDSSDIHEFKPRLWDDV